MIYEVYVSIRARDGKAVTGNLFPPGLVMSTDDLAMAMLAVKSAAYEDEAIVNLGADGLFSLADKTVADIEAGKYKWEIHKEKEGKK